MKKLIDLLNEFCREKRGDYVVTKYREKEHSFDTFVEWKVDYMTDLYVVSKRCWFIKWLVENDKIKRDEKYWTVDYYCDEYSHYSCRRDLDLFEGYESLLMRLSVSDNPIQDLISLLK